MPRRLMAKTTFLQPFAVPASARGASLLAEALAFGQAAREAVAVGDAVCALIGGVEGVRDRHAPGLARRHL
jgi:hypothetical protein